MIILETARLVIRNWEDRDRDLFHVINSDEEVMRFFPFRRDRSQSDELFDSVQKMISETGLGFYALEEKKAVSASALQASPAPTSSLIYRTALLKLAGGWQHLLGQRLCNRSRQSDSGIRFRYAGPHRSRFLRRSE